MRRKQRGPCSDSETISAAAKLRRDIRLGSCDILDDHEESSSHAPPSAPIFSGGEARWPHRLVERGQRVIHQDVRSRTQCRVCLLLESGQQTLANWFGDVCGEAVLSGVRDSARQGRIPEPADGSDFGSCLGCDGKRWGSSLGLRRRNHRRRYMIGQHPLHPCRNPE